MTRCDLPPTLVEHLTSSERPDAYYWFWAIGAVCIIISFFVLFPRVLEFYKTAIKIRDEADKTLLPFSYIACLLIVSFPLFASVLKYLVLLSPISAYTIDFMIKSYEGVVLYSFARLLIMYLGSVRNAMKALEDAPKTKFYAVPPFGCCFKPCVSPSTLKKKDFRRIYTFIIQYALFAPLLTFCQLLRMYEGSKTSLMVIKALKFVSASLCFYALLALLRASTSLLEQYKMHGKFWCIKGLIVVLILPQTIMTFVGEMPHENTLYDEDTLVEAYGAIVAICCFTALSVLFLKFFKPEDALHAMENAKQKDHKASVAFLHLKQNDDHSDDDIELNLHLNNTEHLQQTNNIDTTDSKPSDNAVQGKNNE